MKRILISQVVYTIIVCIGWCFFLNFTQGRIFPDLFFPLLIMILYTVIVFLSLPLRWLESVLWINSRKFITYVSEASFYGLNYLIFNLYCDFYNKKDVIRFIVLILISFLYFRNIPKILSRLFVTDIQCKLFFYPVVVAIMLSIDVHAQNALPAKSVFPQNNIWNTPVDKLPVYSRSLEYVNFIGVSGALHADFGSGLYQGEPMGIPYNTVPGTQTKVNITFQWADESDPGPYPIPSNALIEGGNTSTGDRHVLVVDVDHWILYESGNSYLQTNGSWQVGAGAVYDLSSNTLRTNGWTSADGAGLPIFPGLIRYDEVQAGAINHAIRMTVRAVQTNYIWPARHKISAPLNASAPPFGQRFRLKANYDISGYSSSMQVILKAFKKYGLIVADIGSDWFVSGTQDERWDNDALHTLSNVPGSAFEAVDATTLMITSNSGEAKQDVTGTETADVKAIISVYPNPYSSLLNRNGMVFGNIPSPAHIKVFDMSGDLVYDYQTDTENSWVWKVTNLTGRQLPNGIYIYMISGKALSHTIQGKIVILE